MTENEKNRLAWYCYICPICCGILEVVQEIYKPSTAYKNELTNMLDYAMGNGYRNDMFVTYASAYAGVLDPKSFAEGVNPHLRSYLYSKPWSRTGVIMFDFITHWHNDLFGWIFYRDMQRIKFCIFQLNINYLFPRMCNILRAWISTGQAIFD